MIEGLKFDVTCEELSTHLEVKVAYHTERVTFYETQYAALKSGGAEACNFTNGDPFQALDRKRTEHQNRAELFAFLKKHLIPNEIYRLEESDLIKLELVSKGFNW